MLQTLIEIIIYLGVMVYTFLYLYTWDVIQIDTKYYHQRSTIIPKSYGPTIETVYNQLAGTSTVKNYAQSQFCLAYSKIQELNLMIGQ